MAMAIIWVSMIIFSLLYGSATGRADAVAAAAMEGSGAAVSLCLSLGGMICLWSGVMEVMKRSGLAGGLSHALKPILARLFPRSSKNCDIMEALSSNVSANLLGLGSAATPAGIRAASGIIKQDGKQEASDELCRLVVMNTASIQLLPTTVAGVRASAGAYAAFDILPAVWISSIASVTVGLFFTWLFSRSGKQ